MMTADDPRSAIRRNLGNTKGHVDWLAHRPRSSPFLGFLSRTLNINHKKELLRVLWVRLKSAKATQEAYETLHYYP